MTTNAGREICRFTPWQFKGSGENEHFTIEIAFGIPVSLYRGAR